MLAQMRLPTAAAKIAALLIVSSVTGAACADTSLDTAIAAIEQKMESAEGSASRFAKLRTDVLHKQKEMQNLAQQVQETIDLNFAIVMELGGIGHFDPELGKLEQRLPLLTADIADLQEAARAVTAARQAAQDASARICGYRDTLQQPPYPPLTQFTNKRQQLQTTQDQAEWGVQMASRQFREKFQQAAARMRDLQDAGGKLRNDILMAGQAGTDLRATFQQAEVKAKRAGQLSVELNADIRQLTKQKQDGEGEVSTLASEIAQDVSPRANTAQSVIKEAQLQARLALVRDIYRQQFPSPDALKLPFSDQLLPSYVAAVEKAMTDLAQQLLRAKALDSQLEAASKTLRSIQSAGSTEESQSRTAIAEAGRCLAEIKLPPKPENTEVKIQALIDQCDYGGAEAMLASLPSGTAKRHLEAELSAGKDLESELRSMVETARGLYKECRLNKVTPILKEALTKAQCQEHRDSIQGKLQVLQKKADYEEVTLALFKEADALYRQGKYSDALEKLEQAKNRTSCQRFRDSLENKITIVKKAMERTVPPPSPPQPCPGGYNPYGCL